jgi:hypothetical protein
MRSIVGIDDTPNAERSKLVDVELDEPELPLPLFRQVLDLRLDLVARVTPVGVEVNDYRDGLSTTSLVKLPVPTSVTATVLTLSLLGRVTSR